MNEHKIIITTNPKFRPKPFLLTITSQVGVIGLGIWANSAAMQWSGLVLLAILALALAVGERKNGLTFDEARAEIDRLEEASVPERDA